MTAGISPASKHPLKCGGGIAMAEEVRTEAGEGGGPPKGAVPGEGGLPVGGAGAEDTGVTVPGAGPVVPSDDAPDGEPKAEEVLADTPPAANTAPPGDTGETPVT